MVTVNWTLLQWHEAVKVLLAAIFASQNEDFLMQQEAGK